MIDNQQTAIFKLNQDFNKNKEKISQYIKYAENWQVASVICSYTAMACDVLLIVAMIAFLLKYRKTMQAMLAAFLQTNVKNTAIQSVQVDQIVRTYPPLWITMITMPDMAYVSIFMANDLTHITEDHFEIKLIARLLDQMHVVQPPMFPPRYDDALPSAPQFPEHLHLLLTHS